MSREHSPRPGVTWERELLADEQLVPEGAEPSRPNRATRRAMQRARRATHDACHIVDLPNGPACIHGQGELTPEALDAVAALVAAAQRLYAGEHPEPTERPTARCSMAAHHPNHLYLRDGQSTHCPGDHDPVS